MHRTAILTLLALVVSSGLLGEGKGDPLSSTQLARLETVEARMALQDVVLEAELWRVRGLKVAPVRQTAYGTTVEVAVRDSGQSVSIELRIVPPSSTRASLRGAFTLVRSAEDGGATSFRIVTREEPGCFLSVTPDGDRSLLDVYHLDASSPMYRGVIVPVPFDELITSSLQRITALTASKVDWRFIFYEGSPGEDRRVEALAASIRSRLPALRYADDGALDQDGRFVFISTLATQPAPGGLNCSGFVKWVVDGFVYPLRRVNTSVADAKSADSDSRGSSLGESMAARDPYFGLDWTRTLAALLDQARQGGARTAQSERYDLRVEDPVPYVEDVGYPVADLRMLLYRRAMVDPGMFYLGSVNDVVAPEGLRQHFHTLLLLPYFDAAGTFRVRVFESVVESDLGSLEKRYPGAFVHLVRVAAEGVFSPLRVP
jgi:hypothetical protein